MSFTKHPNSVFHEMRDKQYRNCQDNLFDVQIMILHTYIIFLQKYGIKFVYILHIWALCPTEGFHVKLQKNAVRYKWISKTIHPIIRADIIHGTKIIKFDWFNHCILDSVTGTMWYSMSWLSWHWPSTLKSVHKVSNITIIYLWFMENIIKVHTWPIVVNKDQCNIWRQWNFLNSIGFINTPFLQRHLTQIIKTNIINGLYLHYPHSIHSKL